MKRLIFLILWYIVTTLAGTPGHETVVTCDFGCILAETSDKDEHVICAEKQFIKISPDPEDNWYRITILSGFPLGHANDRFNTPRYEQDYTWWEDYERVSLDGANCLTVSPALLFAVDIIGQCPPQEYKPEALPNHGIRTNPYWFFYGPGKSYTESSSSLDDGNDEESFAPIDAGASNSAIILGLGTLAEIGATSSIDDHPGVLSLMDSSNNNIFDLSDNVTPLLLSSDGGSNNNNNNAPDNMYSTGSSFISNNLQEGGQEDYSSLFA